MIWTPSSARTTAWPWARATPRCNSRIVITGLDGTPDGYEAIKDGRITGTVAQDGGLMASSGVEAAVTLLDGGTLENNLIIADSVWIDSSNVAVTSKLPKATN